MTVLPEDTLEHLRHVERERRRGGDRRAQRLREHLEDAVSLLRERYGVGEAILFGSLAAGETSGDSDLDLAVRDLPSERYFEALADLMKLIGAPVDLVRLEDAVHSLRERIEAEGERL